MEAWTLTMSMILLQVTSSSTGYYYDPNSGYYGSASTGTWYSYDEQTGAYKEIQDEQTGIVKEELGDAIKE